MSNNLSWLPFVSTGLEWKRHADHLCSTSITEFQPDRMDNSVDIDIPTPQPEDGINENEQQESNEEQEETTQPSRDQGENEEAEARYPSRSEKPPDRFI